VYATLRERRSAPELERVAKQLRSGLGRRSLRLVDEPLEREEVELVRCDANEVPRALRHDHIARADRLAELRHVVLQRVRRRPRGPLSPQPSIRRSAETTSFARVQQQREQRALARARRA
jgi:hypothetical protein